MIKFVWDAKKSESTLKEHNVSFSEAELVFYDQFAIQFLDEDNSVSEDRFIIPGLSNAWFK